MKFTTVLCTSETSVIYADMQLTFFASLPIYIDLRYIAVALYATCDYTVRASNDDAILRAT